ncbi:MAG: helix-turn-helix domain-containing protein [Clostridia bacterium]|nr:helix-turn-helix domain-containing protein [Clostridia bacterium]
MERLKALRKASDKTLKDLAIVFDTSPQVISRYELGQAEPDFNTLIKLADYFNVSVDYLLGHDTEHLPISRPKNELADKFASDYADLLKDNNFLEIVKLCSAVTPELVALALGYIVGLFNKRGVNTQAILGY